VPQLLDQFAPGQRVTVVQQLPQRQRVWSTGVTGTVVSYQQAKTGAWFAHTRDGRLWLDRLVLRKDDGELVVCSLDEYTHAEPAAAPAPRADPGGG
jgi:hypothetical protein